MAPISHALMMSFTMAWEIPGEPPAWARSEGLAWPENVCWRATRVKAHATRTQ
jgi:hypothetical protein